MQEESFEAFYGRHWKYVYRICYMYMKSAAEAEDLTEDVFVRVITGDMTFQSQEHERRWLAVTAGNLCKDRLKSFAVSHTEAIGEDREFASPEPEDNSDVLEAVLNLPDLYKDVVWLYYYDGYQTDEIAGMLGRPASTVRNQLKCARDRLKAVLGGRNE